MIFHSIVIRLFVEKLNGERGCVAFDTSVKISNYLLTHTLSYYRHLLFTAKIESIQRAELKKFNIFSKLYHVERKSNCTRKFTLEYPTSN